MNGLMKTDCASGPTERSLVPRRESGARDGFSIRLARRMVFARLQLITQGVLTIVEGG